MNFSEAMDKLKEGAKVTRETWKQQLYFKMINGVVKSFFPRVAPYVYDENIMVSNEWYIAGKEYCFSEITHSLAVGGRAYRKDWDEGNYITYDKEHGGLAFHSIEMFEFSPTFDSFLAIDWIVL